MHVGVLGLGAMGKAVAVNLVRAGFQTTVWNRSPQPVAELVAAGATGAGGVAELFRCDVVLSVLLDDAAIRTVILDSGIAAAAAAATVHVCLSSVSTGLARDLTRKHAEHGSRFAAASLFGRPEAAASAKLEIVMAGPPDVLGKIETVLRCLGRTWPMGEDPQLACLVKIAGNFMIGCAVAAMAESSALVSAAGGVLRHDGRNAVSSTDLPVVRRGDRQWSTARRGHWLQVRSRGRRAHARQGASGRDQAPSSRTAAGTLDKGG